jgi:DNA invertase Pin-like site-specific DNA recombinase
MPFRSCPTPQYLVVVALGLQEGSIACVRRQIGVRDLFNEGIGASEIARRLKIGRASVYRGRNQD